MYIKHSSQIWVDSTVHLVVYVGIWATEQRAGDSIIAAPAQIWCCGSGHSTTCHLCQIVCFRTRLSRDPSKIRM